MSNRLCSFYPSFRFVLLASLVTVALAGCALPLAGDVDAPMDIKANAPYVLAPGDKIKITVAGETDLSGDYMIDGSGAVYLPMIGEVKAAGYSKAALQKSLRAQFEDQGFLRQPLITVDAAEVRPVSIIGEVRIPGNYDYRPAHTVFQAIATAGGYTQRAAKDRILIDRWVDGHIVRMNATQNTPILPGDAITVRERIF